MSNDVFGIDLDKYRIIDLSATVQTDEDALPGRPFYTMRSDTLPDGKDTEAVFTHSHVGTHVETTKHFFRRGNTIDDYPLERFMGEAVILSVDDKGEGDWSMDYDYLEEKLGDRIQKGDIVIWRNENAPDDPNVPHPGGKVPYFEPAAAEFFVDYDVKMIIMGRVDFGKNWELGNEFEGTIHDNNIPIIEMPANLSEIQKERVFVMAFPFKVDGLGSSWVRAVAVEAR